MPAALSLKACNQVKDFNKFIENVEPLINKMGGRKFKLVKSQHIAYTMNQIVHQFAFCLKNTRTIYDVEHTNDVLTGLSKIVELERQANAKLKDKKLVSGFQRTLTKLRQLLGNLLYKARYKIERSKVLEEIRQMQIQDTHFHQNRQAKTEPELLMQKQQREVDKIPQPHSTENLPIENEPVKLKPILLSSSVEVKSQDSSEIAAHIAKTIFLETGKDTQLAVGEKTSSVWDDWDWDEDDPSVSESEEELLLQDFIENEVEFSSAATKAKPRKNSERIRRAFLYHLKAINLTGNEDHELIFIFNASMHESMPRNYFLEKVKEKFDESGKAENIIEKLGTVLPL